MTNKTKKRFVIGLLFLAILAWLYSVYFHKIKKPPAIAIAITATHVIQKDVNVTTRAIGRVEAYLSVSIKSLVEGQLLEVGFKAGELVHQGQILFEIDPRPFQVALDQARANLARDEAQLDNAKKLLGRYSQLTQKGYVSKQDYDQSNDNVKALAASVLADKAAIANADLQLAYCTIRAPIEGYAGDFLVDKGNLVKANDTNSLVVINQVMPIYVAFSLPEQQLGYVKQAMQMGTVPVTIQTKSGPHVIGKLNFIDNTVDTTTGMIQLKAIYPNDNQLLWPGQYVDITLPLYSLKKATLVATRAIQEGPDGPFVFVIDANSRVHSQAVELGPVINNETVIKNISPNTEVVLTGQSQLADQVLVQVVTTESGAL